MFSVDTYVHRRNELKKQMKSGLVLFLGNEDSPMNYPDNMYHFRQDSSFLYFWGLETQGLAAIIDLDEDREILFGYNFGVDDIVWMGSQLSMAEKARSVGAKESGSLGDLEKYLSEAIRKGRKIHYLPQYRGDNIIKIEKLLGIHPRLVNDYASEELIKAVVALRSVKSDEEVKEIEYALEISYRMQTEAMRLTRPGMYEREIAGLIEGITLTRGKGVSFPIIFSIHGETLHNHGHENLMEDGYLVVNDSGAESLLHYASDITRTFPVSGKFTPEQRDVYEVVLKSQLDAIAAIKPGIKYRDVHMIAAHTIAGGMKDLGFMKGNIESAVEQGAHALFFPHGLGHMMGLDVHDMENLGEQYVGYDEHTERSTQFGLAYLRLAKELQPGYVLTVEPGIYFIPELINLWEAGKKFTDFINYEKVNTFREFGGIRIEDDILVTDDGHRVLGKPIPKTVAEVEAASSR